MSSNLAAKTDPVLTVDSTEKAGKLEVVSYGLGSMGYVMSWTIVLSFLAYFYTDVIGISASFVGTLMLIVRVWDGATDVAMGSILDRTTSKHGKARPYLLWLCIPFALSTVALFTVPPTIGTAGKYTYIVIVYSFYILMYTGVSISLKTLLGQITQNQESRASLGVSLAIGFTIGGLLVAVASEPIASAIGGQVGWVIVASLVGLISLLAVYFSFRFTRERVGTQVKVKKEKKNSLILEMKMLSKNTYWILISFFGFALYIIYGLASAEIYYAAHILGNASYYSFIALAQSIPGLLILVVTTPFVKRFGKQKATIVGTALVILSALIKLVDPTSMTYFLIGSAFLGMGTGVISATIYAMVNDTVDYGEWKTKVRTPGLVNSSLSFGMKVGTGLGGAMMGWLLAFSGYVGSAPEQTASAKQMIIYLNMHVPLILSLIMLTLILFYKLDKLYPQIIGDLQQKDSTT